ncbi:MAG: E3 ubiquitin protein ligase [Candidatus Heimdallarchaeota archaeon]|nr:E3 ubiquitin protein ligase [Candidatus Heimdallarchaeota archaeon]MCK5048228.1 E3 ubiquitin protein ligase [Candidatus Heimdallarchaeota archaeon]
MQLTNPINILSLFIMGFYLLPRLFINSKPESFLTIDTRTSVERKYSAQMANLGITIFSVIAILSFSFPDIAVFYFFIIFIFFSSRFIAPPAFFQINRVILFVGIIMGINGMISIILLETPLNGTKIGLALSIAFSFGVLNAIIVKIWLNREATREVSFFGLFSFNIDRSRNKENQLFYTQITAVSLFIFSLIGIGFTLMIVILQNSEIGEISFAAILFVSSFFLSFVIPWSVTRIEIYGSEAFSFTSLSNRFEGKKATKQEKVYSHTEKGQTKAFQPVQTIQPENNERTEKVYSRLCVVCSLPIRENDPLGKCPDCFGETHKNCIEKHVKEEGKCPICYTKISIEEIQ